MPEGLSQRPTQRKESTVFVSSHVETIRVFLCLPSKCICEFVCFCNSQTVCFAMQIDPNDGDVWGWACQMDESTESK